MRRVITIFILIIISFLFQTTILSFHDAAGFSPNLLMIITMSFGVMRGRREGMLTGLVSGFFMDVFFNTLLGPYMLLYMTIGYINGFFHKSFILENALLPVLIMFADEITFNTVVFIATYLMRNRTDYLYFFVHVIMPETVATIIFTVIIYRIYVKVNKSLKKRVSEKR